MNKKSDNSLSQLSGSLHSVLLFESKCVPFLEIVFVTFNAWIPIFTTVVDFRKITFVVLRQVGCRNVFLKALHVAAVEENLKGSVENEVISYVTNDRNFLLKY